MKENLFKIGNCFFFNTLPSRKCIIKKGVWVYAIILFYKLIPLMCLSIKSKRWKKKKRKEHDDGKCYLYSNNVGLKVWITNSIYAIFHGFLLLGEKFLCMYNVCVTSGIFFLHCCLLLHFFFIERYNLIMMSIISNSHVLSIFEFFFFSCFFFNKNCV